ncbi:MAG: hypothetical protein J6P66_03710 [Bacteroidaceae bacterium]|nr:hypothetical protein [Bacteroidaceae bacterium]
MFLSANGIAVTSFAAPEVWSALVQVFIIALAVLAGNILRRKIKILRRSLIPSALLGGLIILLLKLWSHFNGIIDKQFMEIITYHALAIGFIAMSLRPSKETDRANTRTVIDTGTLTISTYLVQGIIGLLITIPMFIWWRYPAVGNEIFYPGGLLLPMGYGQGPGQALNFGTIYQMSAAEQDVVFYGIDFGLSIAAVGFLVGSVVGVVYMNMLNRNKKLTIHNNISDNQHTLKDYEQENELPHSESVDKLTIVIGIVLLTYFLVYLLMSVIGKLDLGNFGENTIKPLVYGFNFFWGIIFGSLVKIIIRALRKRGWMTREYLNEFLLNRISGFSFDVMIVAGTAAISFENLKSTWLPLTFVCLTGAYITFKYVKWVSFQIYPDYPYEGFFSMFGMLTGTASNGMILLREIDPRFETPAANNLVLQNIPAMIMGFPVLLLLGFAPKSMQATLITLGILIVLFVIANLFLFRKRKN